MFELTEKIIDTTLKTGWEAGSAASVAIRWPNVSWRQPDSGEWISLARIPGDGEQASLGASKLARQYGLVIVQIFTKRQTGTRRASALADIVAGIFRHQTKTDSGVSVIFREPQLGQVQERIDQFQTNVQIPYQAERFF